MVARRETIALTSGYFGLLRQKQPPLPRGALHIIKTIHISFIPLELFILPHFKLHVIKLLILTFFFQLSTNRKS